MRKRVEGTATSLESAWPWGLTASALPRDMGEGVPEGAMLRVDLGESHPREEMGRGLLLLQGFMSQGQHETPRMEILADSLLA